jgi:hypothetical protein
MSGPPTNVSTPKIVQPLKQKGIRMVAAGDSHALALAGFMIMLYIPPLIYP